MTPFAPARQALDLFSRPCRHQAAEERERPDLVWHDPASTCSVCVEEELTRTYHLGYLAAVEEAARAVTSTSIDEIRAKRWPSLDYPAGSFGYGTDLLYSARERIRSLAVPQPVED